MPCADCTAERGASCLSQGCYERLCELRYATVAPGALTEDLKHHLLRHLEPGQIIVSGAHGVGEMDRQLDRLEVRHGDILVLRTSQKLQPETATRWQDDLIRMCAAAGVRDVTVVVLDNAAELSIERPATRLVQQSLDVPQPMQVC